MADKNSKRGFTLAELLIVVAIIAVLVAVAIPVFTAQLNKAKYATDLANIRSLLAIGTADYLANGKTTYDGIVYVDGATEGTPGWAGSVLNEGHGVPTRVEVVDEDGKVVETLQFSGVSCVEYYDENCGDDFTNPFAYIDSQYGETVNLGPQPD